MGVATSNRICLILVTVLSLGVAGLLLHVHLNGQQSYSFLPSAIKEAAPSRGQRQFAVVNCHGYHFEILLGFAYLVAKLGGHDIHIYGLVDESIPSHKWPAVHTKSALAVLENAGVRFTAHDCSELVRPPTSNDTPAAAVAFVTAQDELIGRRAWYFAALARFQPPVALSFIHHTTLADQKRLAATIQLAASYPATRLLTLSPLTLETLRKQLSIPTLEPRMDWILPILPFKPNLPCVQSTEGCPRVGFTVQGNLDQRRRNYQGLFKDMEKFEAAVRKANVTVKLIGKPTTHSPNLPDKLKTVVTTYDKLGFEEFYTEIFSSIALLPIVQGNTYLSGNKITSTLVTSLITGTPILADSKFRTAYSFLPATAVYPQKDGESVVTAMLRVMAMKPEEHAAVRKSLDDTREGLLKQNIDTLKRHMDPKSKCRDAARGV